MTPKPSLQDMVRAFFFRRLLLPFAFVSLCALGTVGTLQLRELYRDHAFFLKVLDRYVTSLLSGAHHALREKAIALEDSAAGVHEVSFSSAVGFHRVFTFEVIRDQSLPGSANLYVPDTIDIPLSYFPSWDEWPLISVPYFSRQLNTLTMAVMVPVDHFAAVGELNLESLEKLIADFSQSAPDNVVIVLDRYGNVIYHPNPQIMWSQENLTHEPLVQKALMRGHSQALFERLDGQLVFASSWHVAPWDWILLVAKPLTHALLPSIFWGVLTAVSVLFLLFSLLMGFRQRLERLVIHPITQVTTVLDDLARKRGLPDLEPLAEEAPFHEMARLLRELHRTSRTLADREATLAAQGRELHRILESIDDGVILTDAHGRIVRCNPEVEQIIGWPQFQLLGRPLRRVLSLVDAKTGKPLKNLVDHVLTSGVARKLPGHAVLHSAEGSKTIVTHSAAPVRDESGSIQGAVLVLRDAGVEYEAQRLLEESERKYREIMENMEEAYVELDPGGRVTFCNPALLKILGCSWDELQNRTYRDFTDEATAESMRAFFSEIYATGSSSGLKDFIIHDATGCRKIVEISAGVRRSKDGRIIGFRVLSRDITEKTDALERSRSLERMLMQTQKMESLGTLASGIAHEFNNLLQAMSGYLEMALSKTDPQDPRSRWLTRVQEASFRARDLVQRLLSFARKTEPSLEPLDFNKVVEETLDLVKKSIPRMIEIRKDMAPDLPMLVADRLQLEQVVINLMANARDAIGTDKSGLIHIRTTTLNDEHGRPWVRLEVSDSGMGIPEEIRQRIFDPFFTTKEPGKGTGLGLSTIYGIVTAHGGRIYCESRLGQGTTFSVDFPVRAWAPQPRTPRQADSSTEEYPPLTGAGVLLVDDEEAILELVQGLLEMEGYKVHTATSGEEALSLLARDHGCINVVILDLSMPGMGGRRCLEILQERYPGIPVIVASGDAAHEIFRTPETFGARGVILKPYRLRNLTEALQHILRQTDGEAFPGKDGAENPPG